jgi:hypothetical protein
MSGLPSPTTLAVPRSSLLSSQHNYWGTRTWISPCGPSIWQNTLQYSLAVKILRGSVAGWGYGLNYCSGLSLSAYGSLHLCLSACFVWCGIFWLTTWWSVSSFDKNFKNLLQAKTAMLKTTLIFAWQQTVIQHHIFKSRLEAFYFGQAFVEWLCALPCLKFSTCTEIVHVNISVILIIIILHSRTPETMV